MHPAPSVILFSVLSGAGFGLLAFLGINPDPPTGWIAFTFFFIGYALALGGLFAAFFHLANKKNAVHSWTQWRTSWLSREAISAVAALSITGLYAALLIFFSTHVAVLGYLGAALSLLTVFTTSMIYTQLRSIPRWNQTIATPALFLSYALAGGALLSGQERNGAILMLIAGAITLWHWWAGDKRFGEVGSTLATATQLSGAKQLFEPPHTGENYLTHEMVFQIARKHAQKLRVIAVLCVALIPAVLLLAPLDLGFAAKHILAGLAVLIHLGGALTQRWLFFAEAEHVVGLYYGAHVGKSTA
jgi:DMSO reductase anchor subunit